MYVCLSVESFSASLRIHKASLYVDFYASFLILANGLLTFVKKESLATLAEKPKYFKLISKYPI